MSHSYESYDRYQAVTVAQVEANERLAFIRKTYAHLAGAILCFVIVEFLLFLAFARTQEQAINIIRPLMATRFTWLLVLGGFMILGWVARSWAHSASSRGMQYAGLGLYILLQAGIFFPMLLMVVYLFEAYEIIPQAGLLTLFVFGGLTAGVFITKKDFSFLGPIISVGFMLALGVIVVAVLFGGFGSGFGFWFAVAMVGLSSVAILYSTSQVLHHYQTHQYVAASLELFSAVAILFWYIIQILLLSRR